MLVLGRLDQMVDFPHQSVLCVGGFRREPRWAKCMSWFHLRVQLLGKKGLRVEFAGNWL